MKEKIKQDAILGGCVSVVCFLIAATLLRLPILAAGIVVAWLLGGAIALGLGFYKEWDARSEDSTLRTEMDAMEESQNELSQEYGAGKAVRQGQEILSWKRARKRSRRGHLP